MVEREESSIVKDIYCPSFRKAVLQSIYLAVESPTRLCRGLPRVLHRDNLEDSLTGVRMRKKRLSLRALEDF
jgi:hypothetical protein